MFSSAIRRLNDRRDGAGDIGEDAGFTLIELMVVLLILAILLAIAIPTFLGVTGGANDRAAQSNLNTALTNAKSAATQGGQTYTNVNVALLSSNEPAIAWSASTAALNSQGPVGVYVDGGGNGILLVSYSKSNNGTCWFAVDNLSTVTPGASPDPFATANVTNSLTSAPTVAGTYYGKEINQTSCTAASVPTAAHWGSQFPS